MYGIGESLAARVAKKSGHCWHRRKLLASPTVLSVSESRWGETHCSRTLLGASYVHQSWSPCTSRTLSSSSSIACFGVVDASGRLTVRLPLQGGRGPLRGLWMPSSCRTSSARGLYLFTQGSSLTGKGPHLRDPPAYLRSLQSTFARTPLTSRWCPLGCEGGSASRRGVVRSCGAPPVRVRLTVRPCLPARPPRPPPPRDR